MLAPTAALGELHGRTFRQRLDQDPRALLEAAEQDIMQMEKAAAGREPPWDGFCGLLKVGGHMQRVSHHLTFIAQAMGSPLHRFTVG